MAELTPTNVPLYRLPIGNRFMVQGAVSVTTSGGHVVTGLADIESVVAKGEHATASLEVIADSNDGTAGTLKGAIWIDVGSTNVVYFQAIGK